MATIIIATKSYYCKLHTLNTKVMANATQQQQQQHHHHHVTINWEGERRMKIQYTGMMEAGWMKIGWKEEREKEEF